MTPLLQIDDTYCSEECTACTRVCPSGAIRRLTLPEKRRTPIGMAKVDAEHCLLWWDQECSVCENRCPYEAIAIEFDEAQYVNLPQLDRARCTGCGACQAACPTSPKAIVVVPEPTPRLLPPAEEGVDEEHG